MQPVLHAFPSHVDLEDLTLSATAIGEQPDLANTVLYAVYGPQTHS